jgi:hypothetical protein
VKAFLAVIVVVSQTALAQTRGPVDYAVSAAALSATISYCQTKYGPMSSKTPAGACFLRVKNWIDKKDMESTISQIKSRCPDSSKLDTCITPELGDFVRRLVFRFQTMDR